MPGFALMGAAGYVAPRHMQAIKAVGGELKAAFDPKDSVGVIDRYFPDADFFIEFDRFERHVARLNRTGEPIEQIAICSPNYLHDSHCRFALRSGSNAICEKPLALNPWNIDELAELEVSTGRRISTILQSRLHPVIQSLKLRVDADRSKCFAIDLTYVAPRGPWYHVSWKGDEAKSGGIATNIGVHFFDLLIHVFGPATVNYAHLRDQDRAAGYLVCGRASIRWFLSIDRRDLPPAAKAPTAYRSITIDGKELEFSDGFADLHTESYREILAGRGFGIDVVRPSIELVSALRNSPVEPHRGERHPLVEKFLAPCAPNRALHPPRQPSPPDQTAPFETLGSAMDAPVSLLALDRGANAVLDDTQPIRRSSGLRAR